MIRFICRSRRNELEYSSEQKHDNDHDHDHHDDEKLKCHSCGTKALKRFELTS